MQDAYLLPASYVIQRFRHEDRWVWGVFPPDADMARLSSAELARQCGMFFGSEAEAQRAADAMTARAMRASRQRR